jgi:hypothetical protein
MIRTHAAGLLLVGLLLAAPARADRVTSSKVQQPPQLGTRPNIFVPYVTNTNGMLGVYQGVSPRIYKSPIVDDPQNPQARPVYNLPFYGGVQAFGDRSDGAVPRASRPYVPR